MIQPKDVLIGYVTSANIKDDGLKQKLNGHPVVGNVYQIVKSNGMYFIHIGREFTQSDLSGICIGDNYTYGDNDKISFAITQLDDSNYLDFNLTDDNLDRVNEWLTTHHANINGGEIVSDMDAVGAADGTKPKVENKNKINGGLIKKLIDPFFGNQPYLESIAKSLNYLCYNDPNSLEPLDNSIKFLVDRQKSEPQNCPIPWAAEQFLLFCKSSDISTHSIIDNAVKYHSTDDVKHLYTIFSDVLIELQRRTLTGNTNG